MRKRHKSDRVPEFQSYGLNSKSLSDGWIEGERRVEKVCRVFELRAEFWNFGTDRLDINLTEAEV